MIQREINEQMRNVKASKNTPHTKEEKTKLYGAFASVLAVLGIIVLMWIAMFITYSSRL